MVFIVIQFQERKLLSGNRISFTVAFERFELHHITGSLPFKFELNWMIRIKIFRYQNGQRRKGWLTENVLMPVTSLDSMLFLCEQGGGEMHLTSKIKLFYSRLSLKTDKQSTNLGLFPLNLLCGRKHTGLYSLPFVSITKMQL